MPQSRQTMSCRIACLSMEVNALGMKAVRLKNLCVPRKLRPLQREQARTKSSPPYAAKDRVIDLKKKALIFAHWKDNKVFTSEM